MVCRKILLYDHRDFFSLFSKTLRQCVKMSTELYDTWPFVKRAWREEGKKVVIMVAIEPAGRNSKQNNRCFATIILSFILCLLTGVLFFCIMYYGTSFKIAEQNEISEESHTSSGSFE